MESAVDTANYEVHASSEHDYTFLARQESKPGEMTF
jgi:hypothetical protein